MTTNNKRKKSDSKTVVSSKVKDYGNDPFFVKKANESKKMLDKYGFPEAFQKRPGNV